ncbi:bifunctional 3,4-dihydroxy-2-butanone-4-phosphate synthase/GTP cyclohydrolase II [Allonocardiopsis opalescens]|uniref:Riboflavin biosynthesis protein RibBA n=1 Tax=Allonocardiopsis opalescens TaxID=1144618 RepID=A0A2T0Q407_9ACTN|nr:bifunctional 3,4-dihydroxy-2-butanone-4-phosphate synthase/GTP cyclohydrolase II [Allonocardiopsis opalescens]PRX98441.1 GTP cyclohydrolase II /3,4-dihydroxy-2-butanone 4-phosphate synthase [Allonocardiopsis opalescens]
MTSAASTDAASDDAEPVRLDPVEAAVADIAAGRPVVVADDADRENEGDIIFAADAASPELVAFTMLHCRGLLCVAATGPELDRLQLAPMVSRNTEHMGTAFTVSVDAAEGVTTGISAADRARTIRLLADPATRPEDLARPGHVFPLRARPGGVLERRGHTEAAVDLARLAGRAPSGAICEIARPDGSMARLPELRAFADEHELKLITVAQLAAYRRRAERQVERVVETRIPNHHGDWRAVGYRGAVDGTEHIALVYGPEGEPADAEIEPPLVRVHSECLTGDVFGSRRCDCGTQLDAAMAEIAREGRGVLVYARGHEGRGIGLLHKLRAYRLQDGGADTVDANLEQGLPADARDYAAAAHILLDLGHDRVRLLTNNPDKAAALVDHGVKVADRVPMPAVVTPENLRYLETKRDRFGHDLPGLPAPTDL